MLGRIRRVLVAIIGTGAVLLWLASAGLWVRSYWRGDAFTAGMIRQRPLEPEFQKFDRRYQGLALVVLSGSGGLGIGLREQAQFIRPPNAISGVNWEKSDKPSYPEQPVAQRLVTAEKAPSIVARIGAPSFARPKGPPGARISTGGPGNIMRAMPPTTPPLAPPSAPPRLVFTQWGEPIHPRWHTGDITRLLILPYWALFAALSAAATVPIWGVMRRMRGRHRIAEGCCKVCGYDLRATPERCPECGTVVKPC